MPEIDLSNDWKWHRKNYCFLIKYSEMNEY
jgi:hypothetical protein